MRNHEHKNFNDSSFPISWNSRIRSNIPSSGDSIFFENEVNQTFVLALQILGALYLGFGMMNWMAKNSLIGGIYNRPLIFGNLLHFLVSAFALIKMIKKYSENQFVVIITISILYFIFTISFGYLLRTNPINKNNLD